VFAFAVLQSLHYIVSWKKKRNCSLCWLLGWSLFNL